MQYGAEIMPAAPFLKELSSWTDSHENPGLNIVKGTPFLPLVT